MARNGDFTDIGLAIYLLRGLMDWNQADLSRESGVDKKLISEYEQGKRTPTRRNLGRLVAPAEVDLEFFDRLVAQSRGILEAFEKARRQGRSEAPGDATAAPGVEGEILEAVQEGIGPFLLQLSEADREAAPRSEGDRAWAAVQWTFMEPLAADVQGLFVEVVEGDERSWALAERLCLASETLAAEQPEKALRLASLGVRLAKKSPGPESWRRRLHTWCERFVSYASGKATNRSGLPSRADPLAPLLP